MNPPDATPPEKPFDEPWQAKAFALAVHLSEQGLFTWPEWTQVFAEVARQRPAEPSVGEGEAYWRNWVAALEHMIVERGHGAPELFEMLGTEWRKAFEATPHGEPVTLQHEIVEKVASTAHHKE